MFKKFLKNQAGNIAVSFALASVALVGLGGGIMDFVGQSKTKTHLQTMADAAVLVAANELKLSSSVARQKRSIGAVAYNYVKTNAPKNLIISNVNVEVHPKSGFVDLDVSANVKTSFLGLLGLASTQKVTAYARAQIFGGLPLCVLALDTEAASSLTATRSARLTATGCSVHSNSSNTNAIEVWGQALLRTGLTCSAGGAQGGSGNYIPVPVQDCPVVPNPLASRTGDQSFVCDYTYLSVSSGTRELTPGVYCGGLKITGNAHVEFAPGIYKFVNGKFEITGSAEVEGEHVGFYFSGSNAFFGFHGRAEVEFSAPAVGPMAGMLFFENPSQTHTYIHEITSTKVKSLVGTIYLPKGELRISVNGRENSEVAQESAFTVIVANKITLNGKSNLVLNTDFAATDVPVPESIARLSGQIVLTK